MRRNQRQKRNHSRACGYSRRRQRRGSQHQRTHHTGGHAESLRFIIRQGKQPNLSVQQRQQRKPQRRRGKQRGQSRRRDIRKTAHRKKLNGGKLALRIGKRLEQHHAHLHQRTDQHSGKHHRARSP